MFSHFTFILSDLDQFLIATCTACCTSCTITVQQLKGNRKTTAFLILYPNVATVCCREMRDFFCFCTYIIAIRSFALKFDFTVRDLLRESVQVGKHITVMIML